MKKIKLYLLLLSITSILTANELKIISYNIHHCAGMDGKLDFERIAKVIKKEKPHLVALQEVDQKTSRVKKIDTVEKLSKLTGMRYTTFSKSISFAGGDFGNAILSVYPFEETFSMKLPGGEKRSATGAIIKTENDKFVFINTHLALQEDNVIKSVDSLLKAKAKYKLPSVIVGDFNAVPDSVAINKMLKTLKFSETTNSFTAPADKPKHKIDYIFSSKEFETVSAKVINEPVASDHRPVTATLKLK